MSNFLDLKATILISALLMMCLQSYATTAFTSGDSLTLKKAQRQPDKLRLSAYMRVISDANGNKRIDQNIVGNFKVMPLFRLEAGFRQGERPQHFDSYYHYKLELQTRFFWKVVRVIGRISDNVINYPSPSYRKTNWLSAVECKLPISQSVQLMAGAGYVFSKQNDLPDALPVFDGARGNYPIFRIALRYFSKKGLMEAVYGSYDVFNPYGFNSPFAQLGGEYELSQRCDLMSYFRYQYNYNFFTPNNYFFCLGIVLHLGGNG